MLLLAKPCGQVGRSAMHDLRSFRATAFSLSAVPACFRRWRDVGTVGRSAFMRRRIAGWSGYLLLPLEPGSEERCGGCRGACLVMKAATLRLAFTASARRC